ncbi:MAG: C4-dicarboxylate TRAP transporter substrate-binding protein [Clostridiales bacterium]|nr:C4-dicarboxylate TRAP transporter substrate-binding protein [Clostridiales bacterium]
MKKLLTLCLALILTVSFAACASAKTYNLKIGTVLTETDPLYIALTEVFEKQVEEKTNGDVQVEIYSGGQLGGDEDVLEQAIVGAGVGVVTEAGRLSNYVYDFGVLLAPYIAKDYEEATKLFETETYKGLCGELENAGFKILSFNYYQGERELFTKNPVHGPADLAGQRIRSSGSKVVTATLAAMGANTTVLPWSEAYQALQQQVIEGVEVHLSAAVGSSIQEVTKYLAFSAHQQLLTALVVSNGWFNKLPAEYQTVLMEASEAAGLTASQSVIARNEEYLQTLVNSGIEVVECDVDAFRTACESVYAELGYADIKAKIDAELGR